MSDVDVVIPAYNAESTLAETIDSVLAQTRPPARVIVVDDGSTDSTAAVAGRYGPAVELLRRPNRGPGAAREAGNEVARSDFVLFLDADDCLAPDALRRLRGPFDAQPEPIAVYCRAQPVFAPDADRSAYGALDDGAGLVWSKLLETNFIRTPGCVLMRRSALAAVGGWEPRMQFAAHADWDLWLRLATRGPIERVDDPLLLYRVRPGSLSGSFEKMHRSRPWVYYKHEQFVRGDPARHRATLEHLAVARRAIIRGQLRAMWDHARAGHPLRMLIAASEAAHVWSRLDRRWITP